MNDNTKIQIGKIYDSIEDIHNNTRRFDLKPVDNQKFKAFGEMIKGLMETNGYKPKLTSFDKWRFVKVENGKE